jgi:hypothetical protein
VSGPEVQVFLPYPSFRKSARVLDEQRLNKQRSENLQIMYAILGYRLVTSVPRKRKAPGFELDPTDWYFEPITDEHEFYRRVQKHWVTLMWQHHIVTLFEYHRIICERWTKDLHYHDTTWAKAQFVMDVLRPGSGKPMPPRFIGDEDYHYRMRSNLLSKNYLYYLSKFGRDTHPGLPYWGQPVNGHANGVAQKRLVLPNG